MQKGKSQRHPKDYLAIPFTHPRIHVSFYDPTPAKKNGHYEGRTRDLGVISTTL